MDISIEELLEQEEKKANDKKRAAARQAQRELAANAEPEEYIPLESSRDPRRRDRDEADGERGSARNRYSIEREENDDRRARRSRGLPEEDDVKDGSDKGSANGSVRSRRRSRSPDADRRARPPTRDRDSYRERDRPDRGDFYYGGGRPVVGRDDDRYRPGRDDHRGSRGRDRSPRRGDRDRYSGGGRERRRSPDLPRKPKTPEPTDDERDRRTVFVQQLAARLRTKELKSFFEQVGPVVDAQIVKDRISQRSKGVGYVEFKDEDSVQKAIALTGQKLLGIPIIAQLTEAEKNRQARTTEGTATHSNGVPFHRLYVGNIHFSITEDDLKNVFEPFGELEFVQLQKEEQGRSKGYGFVQFIDPTQAKEALEKMNGFELAGRPIRVGLGNDKFTPESTQSLLQRFGSQAHQAQFQGSAFSGMGGRGAHAGGTANFDRASGRDADKTGGASALDDTDVSGVNFSNYSRDALMRKLARTDEPEPKVAPKAQPKKPVIDQPAPSRCVVLKGMFDQAKQTGTAWRQELETEVREECEDKYGHVVHIGLKLNNDDGELFVKFDRVQGGENAIRGLNGRYFDERMISAQYVVDHVYNMNFPSASRV
ncbi:Phosphatidylinositol-3-phosphatase SAC1 [Vermiconidia calcicola]|uniref:Phosphatidylinositol-3-phosphatase SAC1 n=1 Tax=Vermiconidia calcicola TaxID=1690605 RepID=A0ACC3MXL3_9PEZI|nr:Phosphatidylinositol-3-phosphatase SAC1 [Vermiconidia calcicola]